jgi:hypothetical protein
VTAPKTAVNSVPPDLREANLAGGMRNEWTIYRRSCGKRLKRENMSGGLEPQKPREL